MFAPSSFHSPLPGRSPVAARLELRFCTDARTLLGDLVKRYPKSSPATHAQKEMKTIKRLPSTACTS